MGEEAVEEKEMAEVAEQVMAEVEVEEVAEAVEPTAEPGAEACRAPSPPQKAGCGPPGCRRSKCQS